MVGGYVREHGNEGHLVVLMFSGWTLLLKCHQCSLSSKMGTTSPPLCITQTSVSWLNKHFFFAAIAITHAHRISSLSKFSADNFGRTVCRDLYHLVFDIDNHPSQQVQSLGIPHELTIIKKVLYCRVLYQEKDCRRSSNQFSTTEQELR